MTVQYDLNSLQDLTNSCVLNFRNKDNKKKFKNLTTSAISICALYFTSSLPEIKKKNRKPTNPPQKNVRGIMSFLTLSNRRYFWLVGHLDICYT